MSRSKLFLIIGLLTVLCIPGAAQQKTEKKPQPAKTAEKPDAAKPADDVAKLLSGKVLLPAEGEWLWWLDYPARSDMEPEPPNFVKGQSIELRWPEGKGARLNVQNLQSGNVALVDLKDAEKADKKLVGSDFNYVSRFQVKVSNKEGKPVKFASVILKPDSSEKKPVSQQAVMVDPADSGVALFRMVPAGKASLAVGYGDVKITQDLTIERDRKTPVATAEVILPGDVPVASSSPTDSNDKPAEEKPKEKPAAGMDAFRVIASFLILGAIIFIVYLLIQNRKLTLKTMLEKAGVTFEEDQPQAVPAQPAPTAPPLDPDQVGPAPGPAPSAVAGQPAAASAASGPRLIGVSGVYSGAIFPLTASGMTAGRDTSCDIPLPQDTTASRRHARFEINAGSVTVFDEGSSNGTFVNGQRVKEHTLGVGDEVQVGSTKFRYEA